MKHTAEKAWVVEPGAVIDTKEFDVYTGGRKLGRMRLSGDIAARALVLPIIVVACGKPYRIVGNYGDQIDAFIVMEDYVGLAEVFLPGRGLHDPKFDRNGW